MPHKLYRTVRAWPHSFPYLYPKNPGGGGAAMTLCKGNGYSMEIMTFSYVCTLYFSVNVLPAVLYWPGYALKLHWSELHLVTKQKLSSFLSPELCFGADQVTSRHSRRGQSIVSR